MWLLIVSLLDKFLGIFDWLIKRSSDSQKKRAAAQKDMDTAVEKGDWDAWDRARADRNSTR